MAWIELYRRPSNLGLQGTSKNARRYGDASWDEQTMNRVLVALGLNRGRQSSRRSLACRVHGREQGQIGNFDGRDSFNDGTVSSILVMLRSVGTSKEDALFAHEHCGLGLCVYISVVRTLLGQL